MPECVNSYRHHGSEVTAHLHLSHGAVLDDAGYEGASWCTAECMADYLAHDGGAEHIAGLGRPTAPEGGPADG